MAARTTGSTSHPTSQRLFTLEPIIPPWTLCKLLGSRSQVRFCTNDKDLHSSRLRSKLSKCLWSLMPTATSRAHSVWTRAYLTSEAWSRIKSKHGWEWALRSLWILRKRHHRKLQAYYKNFYSKFHFKQSWSTPSPTTHFLNHRRLYWSPSQTLKLKNYHFWGYYKQTTKIKILRIKNYWKTWDYAMRHVKVGIQCERKKASTSRWEGTQQVFLSRLFQIPSPALTTIDVRTMSKCKFTASCFPKQGQDDFEDDYDCTGNTLGRGAFAVVYETLHKPSNTLRAMKVINRRDCDDESESRLENEVDIMRHLVSPATLPVAWW